MKERNYGLAENIKQKLFRYKQKVSTYIDQVSTNTSQIALLSFLDKNKDVI